MKTKLFFTALLSFFFYLLSSQIPQGFNYQAIARNLSGEVIQNQPVKILVAIQTSLTGGTILWNEEHSLSTNQFGLVSFIVGSGPNISGTVSQFRIIDWNAQTLYLNTKVQYPVGGSYNDMGTSQIWSVPYSLMAKNVEGPIEKLNIKATEASLDSALFEVKNKDGQTIFAVYNEGVRIYVDNGAKGAKGGFAVGGFDMAKGTKQTFLAVSDDSVKIYIDSNPLTKKPKGGFAVGGYDMAKGTVIQNYLDVNSDSIRVYIDKPSKSKKGGFAVGSFDMSKGGSSYLKVTNDSTRVYVSDATKVGSLGGFAVKPVIALSQKTDFFNITNAATAEVIKNEPRVMWYSKKSALIGGEVHVGSADSVGLNSTALGFRSIAKGDQSQAFGYKSIAYGTYSTAIGYKAESNTNGMAVGYLAKASGSDAFALGSGALAMANKSFAFGSVGIDSIGNTTGNTKATGENAYAMGLGSVASGRGAFAIGANDTASFDFATAIGYKTKASNWYALAMGSYAEATGKYATAIGYRNKASGDGSTSFGRFTEAIGTNSFASGYFSKANSANAIAMGYKNQANASGAIAAGYQNTASQTGAAAFGRQTTAAGLYSLAFGYLTNASTSYTFAGGYNSRATGLYSFSFGRDALASGENGFALGYWVKASGYGSTATGYHTKSPGLNSFAAGYETNSKAFESFVVGRWNDTTGLANMETTWNNTDPLFVVGNGAISTSLNNAFTVYKGGSAKVDGNFYPNDNAAFTLGLSTNRWTTIYATNGIINTSDIREKQDIAILSYGLKEIMLLNPVKFRWKNSSDNDIHLGLIAQEVKPVISEVVDTGTDPDNTLGINYSALVPVLIKSIQEQQKIIESQNMKNLELEKQITEINRKLELLEKKQNLKVL